MARSSRTAVAAAALGGLVLLLLISVGPTADHAVALVDALRGLGWAGAALFALGYGVAAALLVPATPFPVTAGFVWGPIGGFAVAWAGELLGASLAFGLGRTLLREHARALAQRYPIIGALDDAVDASGLQLLVLVRLSPVIPFGVLNYGLGLTGVPIGRFLLSTALGVIPASAVLVLAGASLTQLTEALDGDQPAGWGETALTWGGLAATLAVTWRVSRATRDALARRGV